MKNLMNRNKNKIARAVEYFFLLAYITVSSLILSSCQKKELEIQQDFPFEVTTMPVRNEIVKGQVAEIRVTIVPSGNYKETDYFIRYFQFEGEGELKYEKDKPYRPNDRYPLKAKQFRLYYTSKSTAGQSFSIWISDNFGNEQQLDFEFNNKDE